MHRLVATVGLPGAGKSEVVSVFEKRGYLRIHFGTITAEIIKKRKLKVNEANERSIREELRRTHGMAAYAKLNFPKIKAGLKTGNVIIDGMYSWEEYLLLKQKFPFMEVVAVYSPAKVRYGRLANRPVRPLTKEMAYSRDVSQIEKLNQAGPIAMADITIVNTGNLKNLKKETENFINAKS